MATSFTTTNFLEKDYNYLSWLDKQQNDFIIYVSLGNIVSLKVEEVVEMARYLANRN